MNLALVCVVICLHSIGMKPHVISLPTWKPTVISFFSPTPSTTHSLSDLVDLSTHTHLNTMDAEAAFTRLSSRDWSTQNEDVCSIKQLPTFYFGLPLTLTDVPPGWLHSNTIDRFSQAPTHIWTRFQAKTCEASWSRHLIPFWKFLMIRSRSSARSWACFTQHHFCT